MKRKTTRPVSELTVMPRQLNRWIVGGAARAGKSYLALELSKAGSDFFILTVDALLHVYLKKSINDYKSPKHCVREWLSRPRYMDPAKSVTRSPLDDCDFGEDEILSSVQWSDKAKPFELILAVLDAIARLHGKKGWLILDIHPEFHFDKYIKACSDLQLLTVFREPLEAVAASLYWRGFPHREKRSYQYFVLLWLLSVYAFVELSRKYPGKVMCCTTSDICSAKIDLGDAVKIAARSEPLYFSLDWKQSGTEKLFLTPDGQSMALLKVSEVSDIEARCQKIYHLVFCKNINRISLPLWFYFSNNNVSRRVILYILGYRGFIRRSKNFIASCAVFVLRAFK